MLNKDQEQNVAEGSTAIQAGGNVTNVTNITGLTYDEVKNVVLDVFKANFYKLARVAKEIAENRAEEITEKFLLKLQRENPSGLKKLDDPDFQYSLYTVQKEYARNGDKELGDLLVDLLVDRSKQQHRDILQIVLNESLKTAPILTESQLSALSVIFLFGYNKEDEISDHQMFANFLDRCVSPFAPKLVKNSSCYQHLAFSGSGTIESGWYINLESILGISYQGLFQNGFAEKEIIDRGISIGLDRRFFMQCLNDPSKLQVCENNKEALKKVLEEHKVSAEDCAQINALFDSGKMTEAEIKNKCIEIRPYMSDIFETWSESEMKNFTLTSVGIAIGHANVKRLGEFSDLSMWIN